LLLTRDKPGKTEWQLWELMKAFGVHMTLGSPLMFEGNLIEIRVKGVWQRMDGAGK
jgi:hypothetical protein